MLAKRTRILIFFGMVILLGWLSRILGGFSEYLFTISSFLNCQLEIAQNCECSTKKKVIGLSAKASDSRVREDSLPSSIYCEALDRLTSTIKVDVGPGSIYPASGHGVALGL